MNRLAWQLVGVLVLVALAWFHGMTKGKAWVRADWDAANVQAEREAQQRAAENRQRSGQESAAFEHERAKLASELARTRGALSVALRAPLSCDPTEDGHAPTIGDVPVPADAVARLRAAAAGPPAD